jgi:hypothetical protein
MEPSGSSAIGPHRAGDGCMGILGTIGCTGQQVPLHLRGQHVPLHLCAALLRLHCTSTTASTTASTTSSKPGHRTMRGHRSARAIHGRRTRAARHRTGVSRIGGWTLAASHRTGHARNGGCGCGATIGSPPTHGTNGFFGHRARVTSRRALPLRRMPSTGRKTFEP